MRSTIPHSTRCTIAALAIPITSCSGPQPLHRAILPEHQAEFARIVADGSGSPREGFYAWRAAQSGMTVEAARAADSALSETHNPFNARRDPDAVSRGAVIFEQQCAACHGVRADGRGPMMAARLPEMDFHRFATRFAVTIHRGAPGKWFRAIRDGAESSALDSSGAPFTMQPFGEVLAREQIWLVVTYLQSLDTDLPD